MSRRDAKITDAPKSTTVASTAGTSGQRSFRVNGCISSVHPNGVVQRIHSIPVPESAIIRSTKATPNTAMPKLVARRRSGPAAT